MKAARKWKEIIFILICASPIIFIAIFAVNSMAKGEYTMIGDEGATITKAVDDLNSWYIYEDESFPLFGTITKMMNSTKLLGDPNGIAFQVIRLEAITIITAYIVRIIIEVAIFLPKWIIRILNKEKGAF